MADNGQAGTTRQHDRLEDLLKVIFNLLEL